MRSKHHIGWPSRRPCSQRACCRQQHPSRTGRPEAKCEMPRRSASGDTRPDVMCWQHLMLPLLGSKCSVRRIPARSRWFSATRMAASDGTRAPTNFLGCFSGSRLCKGNSVMNNRAWERDRGMAITPRSKPSLDRLRLPLAIQFLTLKAGSNCPLPGLHRSPAQSQRVSCLTVSDISV